MAEPGPDNDLRVLWRAARKLVDNGKLEEAVALSYVIWPSAALKDVSNGGEAAPRLTLSQNADARTRLYRGNG